MRIGFIGVGVVGEALLQAFSKEFECVGYDKFKKGYKDTKLDVLSSELLFLSLPSPTVADAKYGYVQVLSPILETLEMLTLNNYPHPVVLKSTVLPGTTNKLRSWFPRIKLIHNPEFLTAARPYEDFLESKVVHLGGSITHLDPVVSAYKILLPQAKLLYYDDPAVTEIIKYMHNVGLALKVGFCNTMFDLSRKMGVDYEKVRQGATAIGGIGMGHTQVPGPDGLKGYAGACFPKDTKALLGFMKRYDLAFEIFEALDEYNELIRPSEIKKAKIC